ncbi:hypothetical protein ASPFODRAFT_147893 [Aspergillus luchuensis CBS 106.47]|uniref:Uncharacterized protein n=1 Tax=Aspergillus luchuensis (strain CBS 106.47) TaxID=1137211 RepID=A0A1M3T100_ASPLC|nr:hypothetical protein ASPFODRAFT_147893 [Aspergillus luchuensis CBS 106.47]
MPFQCLLAAHLDGTVYPGVHVSNRDVLHAVGQCTQRTWQIKILPADRCVVVSIVPCRGYGAIRPPESAVPTQRLRFRLRVGALFRDHWYAAASN